MPKIRKKLNLTIEQVIGRRGEAVRLPLTSYRTALMRHEQGSSTIGYDVLYPTASTPTSNHEQRLQLLCLLDHDGQIPPSRAVCSGCADSHGRHLFTRKGLGKPNRSPHCMGSAGYIWICPHRIFDYGQATASELPASIHKWGNSVLVMASSKWP